jgi:hypothetical protein
MSHQTMVTVADNVREAVPSARAVHQDGKFYIEYDGELSGEGVEQPGFETENEAWIWALLAIPPD